MLTPLKFQFVRFLLVGGLNTGFSYAIYASLLFFGLSFAWANLGAVLIGIAFSFRTQGSLVFNNRDKRLIIRFAGCWLMIWLVNISMIAGFMRAGLDAYWAGALALAPITLISYVTQKRFVFGNSVPKAS